MLKSSFERTIFSLVSECAHLMQQGQLYLTVSYLEVEKQVVKLEQVVKVQLESDWTHVCRTNKQNSYSTLYDLFCSL